MIFQEKNSISFRKFSLFIFISILIVSCKNSEPKVSSAYISKIFGYVYGPGQHALLAKPSDISNFIGEPTNDKGWLYLGGFGGYVIAGFDHNVINGNGFDFEVIALKGASPEPGIVYVMPDTNGDGLPNDTWYELKGNQFANSKRHYWVRYYKAVSDSANITWKDSESNKGQLISGYGSNYSSAWWWPATTTDSITFYGTRLPDAYDNLSTPATQYWAVPADRFTWGYAKNLDGTDYDSTLGANKFDISNAVDSLGNAVNLPNIRFIKIQTAVFQQAGWLNEVSTEVRGARDLRE
ncbi:MAG: hypothetical protein P4L34_00610 [Paludibacter sp.]|nr:hypothetical protein [Paludibacter sp.]